MDMFVNRCRLLLPAQFIENRGLPIFPCLSNRGLRWSKIRPMGRPKKLSSISCRPKFMLRREMV